MQSLRVALHLGVVLALTLRSTRVGDALHPYERALANEWIHLLFYVDTTKTVRTYDPEEPLRVVPVTLPNFLLESVEEIAANVEDEVFSGGFAARASSYPVGMLFTIDEARKHLHGAMDNYNRLADTAIDKYFIAGHEDDEAAIPYPELTTWTSWDGDSIPHKYTLTGLNESEWPGPLQLEFANATATRKFFDQLDGMELMLIIGMKQNDTTADYPGELFKWWVRFTYDLHSQGHLEVSINFGLRPQHRRDDLRTLALARNQIPGIFFDHDTAFDWCLVGLIALYEATELFVKWGSSRTLHALRCPRSHSYRPSWSQVWSVFKSEARDFWFWFVLVLNLVTVSCVLAAWDHAYRLYLWDGLCLAFATCCALQWVSLVQYLRVNARFHILGLTLQRGLPRVAQFLVGVFPIFVGYVLFGTIMFGAKVPRFQSAGTTATTLFSVANGDEIHDTFNDVAFTPWIGQFYIYSYLILFSYVVLMVCIGIIEDAFFSAVFPASWPSLHTTETDEQGATDEAML